MWNPSEPNDFSQFEPTDILAFLDWFELAYSDAMALGFADAFIEGVGDGYLEALQAGDLPPWLQTMMNYRMAAQWSYQLGQPLAQRMTRDIGAIIPGDRALDYANRFRITPEDIADIPPGIRGAFNQGMKSSLSWVKRLSNDARQMTRDVIAIETLKNRNPLDAAPLLERILTRDRVAKELGINPSAVTAEQIEAGLQAATETVVSRVATRAKAIARTESMRLMFQGTAAALEEQGFDHAYVMPHSNSCPECRRLIDGRVFPIAVLKAQTFSNFGKPPAQWVAALPQHPNCRHSIMSPPVRFRAALQRLGKVPASGVVLQWYGLRTEAAMVHLGLPPVADWLLP